MNTNLESNKGKVIPATKRPDGTWRKARRVKDGYVPQEEVPLYESKGKQFIAQRQTGVPPGMCPILAAEMKKVREKKEKANEKKVEKQQITKAAAKQTTNSKTPNTTNNINNESPKDSELSKLTKTLDKNLTIAEDPEVDLAKQIKKLKKKIREIEQIESKIQSGDSSKLDKDQLEKVKKKPQILNQLKALEENSIAIQHT
ncbi:PREDICTED: partner of Y14 and mago [Drosophila arizonae]|uniref:Partner of Y14 and mago n=1 Tax=Drosophila arizonae TaxID=7263 RepID=A0ABM1PCV5_DROAR|nr:PREDICTED: partner of Y14 and mago [Drosophila arizonae]